MIRNIWQSFASKKRTKLRIIFRICKFFFKKMNPPVSPCNQIAKIVHSTPAFAILTLRPPPRILTFPFDKIYPILTFRKMSAKI